MRRNKVDIAHEILKAISEGADTTTRLCYRTNLSWVALNEVLEILEKSGFIEEENVSKKRRFKLRPNALKMIDAVNHLRQVAPLFTPPHDREVLYA